MKTRGELVKCDASQSIIKLNKSKKDMTSKLLMHARTKRLKIRVLLVLYLEPPHAIMKAQLKYIKDIIFITVEIRGDKTEGEVYGS